MDDTVDTRAPKHLANSTTTSAAGVPQTLLPSISTLSVTPTLVIPTHKPVERSVSAGSVESATSRCSSVASRSSEAASRRRGFARPQATSFAESARNRESVLSLGTIAHLQYYFARTGLLDGKGAQLYRKTQKATSPIDDLGAVSSSSPSASKKRSDSDSTYSSMRSSPDIGLLQDQENQLDARVVESPIQEEYVGGWGGDAETAMLPPTVSTYNHRQKHVPRPPSMDEMRKEVKDTLLDAFKVLRDAEQEKGEPASESPLEISTNETSLRSSGLETGSKAYNDGKDALNTPTGVSESQGWHEIQGMHILDLMTLAIRAAKIYYTAHEQPGQLSAIRSERKIREEFLVVMDSLKRMASRNFAGGLRESERLIMQRWIEGVRELLAQEEEHERQELQERESWVWMSASGWDGREREREWSFLRSFDVLSETLPSWIHPDETTELPTPFLRTLQNGVRLIRLHNDITAKSKRPFGQISKHHSDTSKPYRCAENLRYWVKAVELRWEIVLKIDVMGVVYGREAVAWKTFDAELLRWCCHVREAFTMEWKEKIARETPVLLPPDPKAEAVAHWEASCQDATAPWAR